ncbi:MAG: glycosyltransferase family 4 protein [Planctomycetaceae bacterium]|nr:glycosyltransferase family 4 protein [Planctomycetaceae bacterium]
MPIHADQQQDPSGVNAESGIHRHETEKVAIQSVVGESDVVLTWGIPSLKPRLANFCGHVIAMSHGASDWTELVLKDSVSRASAYVAVSMAAVAAFPDSYRRKVTTLPPGIELDRIAPARARSEFRTHLGLTPQQKAIGYIGRFSDEKNPLQTARIVGSLDDGYVAVYYGARLWGDSDFRAQVTKLCGHRVRFIGPEVHAGDVYAALDCLVQASPSEGGPLVAVEAWLSGLPLVSTPVGVVADELANGREWGCIVPYAAPLSEWRAAVVSACSADSWALAQTIRQSAVEYYSAAAMARRWETYLSGLCQH